MELAGRHVTLEALRAEHAAGLVAAAAESRDTYSWAPVPKGIAEAEALIASRLKLQEAGTWMTFATRSLSDGRIVGSTSFLNIERWEWPQASGDPDSVEIGATWLASSAQRSAVNTEAKLLMLTQAFDAWGVQRVQIKTDARNARSRAAIERLGASFEGVLRSYQPAQGDVGFGGVRDTAMYSIVRAEWPRVRLSLTDRLERP